MRWFRYDPKLQRFVQHASPPALPRRRGIDPVMEALCGVMPLKRPMTAREIEHSQRIERMRAAGTLPSREEFERMLNRMMGEILIERIPLATKKIQ